MKTCCVVVIGHVDHGKTALVEALTGIETDRLPEEKIRGLSITPGFAHHTYPGGTIDFVDAPGHEDFIHAMIAGATGAHAVLAVISVVEGLCAQTREHLAIAGLLGITSGVIAVTKSDLISPSEQSERLALIRKELSGTAFANIKLVLCSGLTGAGISALHHELEQLLSNITDLSGPMHCFLPIDRVFSLSGHGTIVTGTLLGQDLAFEDSARLLPNGQTTTIRGLQSRSAARDRVHAGERVAVNLRGVAVSDIARGDVLVVGSDAAPSTCMDVHLQLLPEAKQTLKHMDKVRVFFGTSSTVAQVRLFGAGQISPSSVSFAQLRLNKPVIGYAGQRAIIRRLSPPQTIGGAIILDPQAAQTGSSDKGRMSVLEAVRNGDASQIAMALCAVGGGVAKRSDMARLARIPAEQTSALSGKLFENITKDFIAPIQIIEDCTTELLHALSTYHVRYPLRMMAPRSKITPPKRSLHLIHHVEAILLERDLIQRNGNMYALTKHDPVALLNMDQRQRMTDIEEIFRHSDKPLPPSSVVQNQLDQDLFNLLLATGQVVSVQNVSLNQILVFHTDILTNAAAKLATAFPSPTLFTTSQARAALDTSRRIIVPVLEHFDSRGITLRNGNARQMAPPNVVSKPSSAC